MSSTEATPIDPNTNPYAYLGFVRNADGSITRVRDLFPAIAASSDPSNSVLTKDVPINQETGTWARLYLPRLDSEAAVPTTKKLPVIVFYHGSGFVVCSAASSIFHKSCSETALELPAIIVSVEYRLAPEHRLPAAYDDGEEALHWVKASEDEWLTKYADFSNCYLMGSSAGANIAYHVASREAACVDRLTPLKIQGVILEQPFFGGVERTPSEIKLATNMVLPLSASDLMWALALPIGVDRDHEYCNSMKTLRVEILEKMKGEGWRFLVTGCDGDPLIDREREFARILEENGVNVTQDFREGGFHGTPTVNGVIKKFILASL